MRGGPDFYAESRAGAATPAADMPPFSGACRRRTEYITAIERRRNGGSLNGGRASETFIPEGIQQAFVEFKFGKSRYSHVLPLCGALIIDVTAAIFICLYGYPFSGIVFTRRCRRFLQGCFYMSQSGSVLRRNGFTFKQFLSHTIGVR